MDRVADFYGDLGVARQPDVNARAETDQADAFAARDEFAGFFPRDAAASDETCNLFELNVATRSSEREDVLFVLRGGFGIPCGQEFARVVFYLGDCAG